MKKTFLASALLLCSFASPQFISAQCPTSDITLSTQSQVNAFQLNFPGCKHITESLSIESGDITNLSPLSQLTHVDKNLNLYFTTNVINLDGLQNIISVGNQFTIVRADKLSSLNGLTKLASVGELQIQTNANLQSLGGLTAITSLGGLELSENPKLVNLQTLAPLTSLGYLHIYDCNALPNVTALQNLSQVFGSIDIRNNKVLTSLNGLSSVTSIGEDVVMMENPLLSDLLFLAAITTIPGELYIENNATLASLDGLQKLKYVGEELGLKSCKFTTLDELAALEQVGGVLNIEANPMLTSLAGLSGVTSVGALNIDENTALTSVDGLNELESAEMGIVISSNPVLTNLNGLSSLSSDVNTLTIYDNALLTDISGLSKVKTISSMLTVSSNSNLSNCAISPFCYALANNVATIQIDKNSGGCESLADVETACAALPVKLSSLSVTKEHNDALIVWQTVEETNSDQFEIQRSSDAISWSVIGKLAASGESNGIVDYSYIDKQPGSGTFFYRLRMIDRAASGLDRTFAYSRIVDVKFSEISTFFFPNPAADVVYHDNLLSGQNASIVNAAGVSVWQGILRNGQPLNVSKLTTGRYIFSTGSRSQKILIVK